MKHGSLVRVVIVMGVSGSGKSTVGESLAEALGGKFFDADDFHPKENIEKMENGEPLNDADRRPWLKRLRDEVIRNGDGNKVRVLACSALKKSYREMLSEPGVEWIYLRGSREILVERLEDREGHFMKADMLDSQLDDLEAPSSSEAIIIDISTSPEGIIEQAIAQLPATKR